MELGRRIDEAEPARSIDLGERLGSPRLRRPLHLERVALDRLGIEVALHQPGLDPLSTGFERSQRQSRPVGRGSADLLGELPNRRGLAGLGFRVELALGNRPSVGVLVGPEGTAGMDEQDLHSVRAGRSTRSTTEDDDAGTGRTRPLASVRHRDQVGRSTANSE